MRILEIVAIFLASVAILLLAGIGHHVAHAHDISEVHPFVECDKYFPNADGCIISYGGQTTKTYDGDDDISLAMNICEMHFAYPEGVYDDGWKSCYKIREAWSKTELARQLREREEAIKHEQEFVNHLAEMLSK